MAHQTGENRPVAKALAWLCLTVMNVGGPGLASTTPEPITGNSPQPRFFTEESPDATKTKKSFTTRCAIKLSPDEGWRHSLTVSPDSHLDVTFAMECPTAPSCSGKVHLLLRALKKSGPATVLLDKAFRMARRQQWTTERIDLRQLGGEAVDLELTVGLNPSSRESSDGIDKPFVWWAEPLWVSRPSRPFHNVLLISLDTLRADRLGSYGYDRNTSPQLDALAAAGARFNDAISQAPWTIPSHMTLLTSLYPSAHGVNQGVAIFKDKNAEYRGLPKGVPTLAGMLRENGYRTLALTGGVTMPSELFFHGFDVFQEGYSYLEDWHWSRLMAQLDEVEEIPFFLFFHTFEVHAPYTRTSMVGEILESDEVTALNDFSKRGQVTWISFRDYLVEHGLYRREVTSGLYDGGVRHADDFLGRLFDELKRRKILDKTLVIITSDHGDELGENNQKDFYGHHGHNVSQELIRVPLIFRMAGRIKPGITISTPVELIDVAPTILELLGIRAPASLQGRSLVPLIEDPDAPADDWALSEATAEGPEMKALRNRRFKYVVAIEPEGGDRSGFSGKLISEGLFDLDADPGEDRSLHGEHKVLLESMREQLLEIFGSITPAVEPGETTKVSKEMAEQLRALGYID